MQGEIFTSGFRKTAWEAFFLLTSSPGDANTILAP